MDTGSDPLHDLHDAKYFAQALGPREELDERQSQRNSIISKLRTCLKPALYVTLVPALVLNECASTLLQGIRVRSIYFLNHSSRVASR